LKWLSPKSFTFVGVVVLLVWSCQSEEILVVKPGSPSWNAFQTFPSGNCLNFLVSTIGSDEVRVSLAAAPGWTEKSYVLRITPFEASLMTGLNYELDVSSILDINHKKLYCTGDELNYISVQVILHFRTFLSASHR
jgi:hypothetical protein